MSKTAALTNRAGLAILAASAAIALACATLPQLAVWADTPGWIVLAGLLAYAGTVLAWTLQGTDREAVLESPELRAVRGIRDRLADLDQRPGLVEGTTTFARSLADTVSHLDRQLIPALELLVVRHAVLEERLVTFDRARWKPGPEVLARLYDLERRQRNAIADCVRQAADAEAALLVIAQEGGDEEHAAVEVAQWTRRLLNLHDALLDVLRVQPV